MKTVIKKLSKNNLNTLYSEAASILVCDTIQSVQPKSANVQYGLKK